MTNHVTKSELQEELAKLDDKFPTKQDLADVKQELKGDIADVKTELISAMTIIADDLKRHFDFTVERIRADNNDAVALQLGDHERRLLKLEDAA